MRVEGGNEFVSDNRLWARHEDFAQGPSGFLVPVIKFRWLVHMARQIAPLGHQDLRTLEHRQGIASCFAHARFFVHKTRQPVVKVWSPNPRLFFVSITFH